MGAKSKKSKPAQVSDATSHKLRNDVETVRNIYKRLRKGLDLKTLCKEADNLEKITLPTAVTRLCRAKVDLNQIADTMKEKALYDFVPRTSSPEPSFVYLREQILEVIDITREGAELYNSLLCGTLCAKLAHVLGQPLDTFKMPTRPELLADPNAELVEQVHSFLFRGRLCAPTKSHFSLLIPKLRVQEKDLFGFEKWDRKTELSRQKTLLRLEMEKMRKAAGKDIGATDIPSLATGLIQAGVLSPKQQSSLESIMSSKHRHEAKVHTDISNYEINRLLATPGYHQLALENTKSVADEGDAAKRKVEEHKKRGNHKQADPDAVSTENTSAEVLAYVTARMEEFQGNDARLAALQELSSVNLGDIYKICLDQNEPPKEAFALKFLVPPEGSVGNTSLVMLDSQEDTGLPFPAAIEWKKESLILSLNQGHGGMRDDSRQRRGQLTFTEVAEQAFVGYGLWPGQAPSSLTPLESSPASEENLLSASPEAVPLNEPALTFCSAVSKTLIDIFLERGFKLDKATADRVAKIQLRQLLTNAGHGDRPILAVAKDKSMAQMNALLFEPQAQACLETGLADIYPLDIALWLSLNVKQLGELADKDMDQLANRRGQLAVTLAELNDRTDQDFDVLALLKTYEKALMLWPSTEPFVHRLMSKLEKHNATVEGEANDCLYSTLVAEQAEKGSTGGFSDGVSSPMSAWLDNAGRRFSDTELMQMRTVALQELVLAVQVLLDGKQFTSGIASAVCAHIQQVLRKEQLLHSPNCDIYLEHAQLLPLIPLLDLVDFLWFQLGLRFSSLPLVDSVRRRLFEFDNIGEESLCEIHPDGVVKYSSHHMQRLWCCALQAKETDTEQTVERPSTDIEMFADTKLQLPDETLLKMHQKPVVEEVLLKQLVNNLYNPEDHMPDNMSLEEVEAREEDVAHVHHDAASYALQEAAEAVIDLTQDCAHLVQALDAASPEPQLPLMVVDSDVHGLLESYDPALVKHAVAAFESMQYAFASLHRMQLKAAEVDLQELEDELERYAKLQKTISSHLRTIVGYMGGTRGDLILNFMKAPELYDEHFWRLEAVVNKKLAAADDKFYMAEYEVNHHKDLATKAGGILTQGRKAALNLSGVHDIYRTLEDCLSSSQHDLMDRLQPAADLVAAVQLHIDALAMHVQNSCRESARSSCLNTHMILYQGQNVALAKKLATQAKEHKEKTRTEAADKTMQELLAAEDKSHSVPEGPKKGKKKKKAAAKLREGKSEVGEQPSMQEAALEESAEDASFLADTAESQADPLDDNTAEIGVSTTAPLPPDTNGFGDYQLQLREGVQQEDWNTVDKKRKAKAGSRQDAASESGLQGSNSGAAAAIEVDPEGWEVAPNLVIPAVSKEPSGQDLWSEVDTKKTRKGKGTTQHEKNGWDDDDDEDAASSMSDPFGGNKAASFTRPASAMQRQSGKQADDSHSRQSLKSPSKQTSGDTDVQCNKCGRYGHMPANCNDLHCDFCSESGHTIKQCDKHKELLSQQAQAAAKQKQPIGKEGQKIKRQDEQSGKQDQWAAAREAALRRVPNELRMACHWCGRDGHRKANCPWNQNGPFFDPNIGPRQLGTDRQQASIKSRAPRPGQEATPPQPGKTLPLKPTRPTPGTGASGLDQQTGSDYPSLTGNAHMPPGVPMPGGTAGLTQPSQPMSSAWGPAAKASAPQPSVPPGSSRQQHHSAQMPSTSAQADSDFPQGPHPHNAFNGGHGFSGHTQHPCTQTFPPDGTWAQGPYPASSQTGSFPQPDSSQTGSFPQPDSSQTGSFPQPGPSQAGSFPQHASQDPRRRSSDQALQSPWGPQGQPVFHPGMLPGGMHPQNMMGAAMHPGSTKLHDTAPGDQLSATHDPVVSPSLIQRGPGAAFTGRGHQLQQQNFNPNAPLQAFAIQEVSHPEPAVQAVTLVNNEDQDLEDFMSDIIGLAENGGQEQAREPYMPPGHLTPGALQPGNNAWGNPNSSAFEAEDDEETQLQKVVQASLQTENMALAQQQQQQLDMFNSNRPQTSASSNGTSAGGAGLRNATGEYNCFLNVIIQCLWRCQAFRKQIMQWEPQVYQDNAIVAALMDLFVALGDMEEQQLGGAVDPNPLREALSSDMKSHFRIGQMHDAGEVLLTLYDALSKVAQANNQPHLLDRIFGLHVKEAVHCSDCDKDTHVHTYTQYFFNVIAAAIPVIRQVAGDQELGVLLQTIEGQTQKSCDSDFGGCGNMRSVQHTLSSMAPKVFTMQLAWQSANETKQDIAQTLGGLQEELNLSHVYHGLEPETHVYQIRSMVCYYGQHYMAVALMADNNWYMFDDATVLHIGQWSDVVAKCVAGRTQPSVLFFEQVQAAA